MSSYDIEREKQNSSELRSAFRAMFPMVDDNDLPWAPCHIAAFLRGRVKDEVERGTASFISRISRILVEASPPKNHMEDMARIVVEKAKKADELTKEKERRIYYQNIVYAVCNLIDRWRNDGTKVTCGTFETPSTEVQKTLANLLADRSSKPC